MKKKNRKLDRIAQGINLITFGVVALLITSGNASFGSIIFLFSTFWPVLIVIAGVKLVLNSFDKIGIFSLMIDILFSISLIAFLLYPSIQSTTNEFVSDTIMYEKNSESKTIPHWDEADIYTYELNIAATSYTVSDTSSSALEVFSTNTPIYSGAKYDIKNKEYRVNVSNSDGDASGLKTPIIDENSIYSILTSYSKDSNYILNTGASKGELTFKNKGIQNFNINLGGGEAEINFYEGALPKNMNISMGAGQITIMVPKDSSVVINYEVGLGSIKANGESISNAIGKGTYQLNDKKGQPLIINAEIGFANLEIKEFDSYHQ